ncbi:uncharacterized protein YprB with RNaseH-like and TPR domain [Peribacillus deserti]|uniref:Uncharacterized protein YprB with RNaseH-like and TPR domain n=1 Tax=Peribacillus deserti TaxID=673318 RepID=A0ABS2QHG1_9BACI|nr:ribonuclease H-like domain-containing protein [Peribacillus deserti]MBM7692598.1 uncharacterized protein YprB with RNaseH-like and TPR domain [Peribacillus deserti]
MSLKNKLGRLKGHMSLPKEEHPLPQVPPPKIKAETKDIPFMEKWTENSAHIYQMDNDYCFIREVHYPLEYQHGLYSFNDAKNAIDAWNEVSYSHPLSSKGINAEEMFFFDTETTGLGGGAGNTIFMLGYAFFSDHGVTVRQHILPNPGAEVPLYQSFLENVNYNTLVTYNGKAFDWPQLKTRHTLIREHVPRLPQFGHFDLYHASRRLWKNDLEKVKLINVEKNILGIERQDDMPGYLAPYIYFDYLERKDPEGMFGIIRHNEIDVLTLITLYTHLSRQLLQKEGSELSSYEVARWYLGLGEKETAIEAYNKVLQGDNDIQRVSALHTLAYQWKKNKEEDKAIKAWETVVKEGLLKEKIEACIEMAKIYEHSQKLYRKAMEFTEIALSLLPSEQKEKRAAKELDLRLKRLIKKEGSSGN